MAGVLKVVDERTKQDGQHLQVGQSAGQARLRQNPMGSLRHIGRMDTVVIWVVVLAVAHLQGQQKILQYLRVYLNFFSILF